VPEGLSAEKASKRIVRAYGKWEAATAQLHEIAKATGEKLKAAEASFREQIEAGVSVRSEAEAKKKLNAVTGSWQELQETIAANIEERKHAKEERKKAAKALERAVEEARQLPLFADD
jgi:protein involved in temperature-dependent protein secretion